MRPDRPKLFLVLTRNALLEYLRDPLTNLFTFAMPIMFFAIFAVTMAVTGAGKAPAARVWQFAYVDDAHNAASIALRDAMSSLHSVAIVPMNSVSARNQLARNDVQAVIFVPARWDGTNTAALRVTGIIYAKLAVEDALSAAMSAKGRTLVRVFSRFTEFAASGRNYFQFTITGLLSLALLQLGLYGTASPLLTSKRNGVFRRYGLTPMPLWILMLSHISVRIVIALLQVAVLTSCAVLFTGLELEGGVLELVAVTAVAAVSLISLGYLMGGAFKRYNVGLLVVLCFNFYLLLFGQIFADLREIPLLKWLVYLNPLSYVSDAFRHVFLGARPEFMPLWCDFAVLCGWTLLFLVFAAQTFTFETRTR